MLEQREWQSGSRSGWTRRIRSCLVAGIALGTLFLVGSASATMLTATLTPFTGSDVVVEAVFDDAAAGSGQILVSLTVVEGIGDLRAAFFNLDLDASLLSGLEVIDSTSVTGFDFGDAINLGGGANVYGGGSPCHCDFGVEFGSPGIGSDDLQSVTFTLNHESILLNLGMFEEIAARLTSVGLDADSRNGSAKLAGAALAPEPPLIALLASALVALAARRNRST